MAFQQGIVTEEAKGLQWWKTRQHAAQPDESLSPDKIPNPVLNIVRICMYCTYIYDYADTDKTAQTLAENFEGFSQFLKEQSGKTSYLREFTHPTQ